MYYVYEWFIKDTDEVFYVGKGCRNRYKVRKHNKLFNEFIKRYDCDSRIIKTFEIEQDAFAYEYQRIAELKSVGQCVCNIHEGGTGGTTAWWTDDMKIKYSEDNVMKSEIQRKRMSENNPMKDANTAKRVGEKHRRHITVGDTEFETIGLVANHYNVTCHEVYKWLKSGENTFGEKCFHTNGAYEKIKRPNRTKPTCKKPVFVDGKYFETKLLASKYLGISISTFNIWIKQTQPHKGHRCEYANQQPSQSNISNSRLKGSTTNE